MDPYKKKNKKDKKNKSILGITFWIWEYPVSNKRKHDKNCKENTKKNCKLKHSQ